MKTKSDKYINKIHSFTDLTRREKSTNLYNYHIQTSHTYRHPPHLQASTFNLPSCWKGQSDFVAVDRRSKAQVYECHLSLHFITDLALNILIRSKADALFYAVVLTGFQNLWALKRLGLAYGCVFQYGSLDIVAQTTMQMLQGLCFFSLGIEFKWDPLHIFYYLNIFIILQKIKKKIISVCVFVCFKTSN